MEKQIASFYLLYCPCSFLFSLYINRINLLDNATESHFSRLILLLQVFELLDEHFFALRISLLLLLQLVKLLHEIVAPSFSFLTLPVFLLDISIVSFLMTELLKRTELCVPLILILQLHHVNRFSI